jgi:hypothetical protein
VQIAVLLRAMDVHANSAHPLVCMTWADDPTVTDEVLKLAVTDARESKPTERIPVNYLKGIVERHAHPPAAKPTKANSDDWEWKRSDGGIERKGREMGMFARGGESYRDFAGRIDDEIRKRKGAKP